MSSIQRSRESRRGYALLMCLMVVAISSSVVLTLFHSLRLQTAESLARRQVVVNELVADAAFEHAVAILLDNPSHSGGMGPITLPHLPQHSCALDLAHDSNGVQVVLTLNSPGGGQKIVRTITTADLATRRGLLGLN